MRHGPAGNRGDVEDDFHRPLTKAGTEQTASAAKGLRAISVKPDALLSSPLTRALQTAEIVAKELGLKVSIVDALAAGATPGEILEAIRERDGDVLIVGHDPDFSALVSYLLAGETQTFMDFSKSGIVALRFKQKPEHAAGSLLWYMRRKQLASLSK